MLRAELEIVFTAGHCEISKAGIPHPPTLMFRVVIALVISALTAAGCSSDPAPTQTPPRDAGQPSTDAPIVLDAADVPVDVPPEAMVRPMRDPQAIYGLCDSDAECRDGYTCQRSADTGYPGGQCNRECTRNDECARVSTTGGTTIDGYCLPPNTTGQRYCARVCANGIDCGREGWSCTTLNSGTFNQVNVCIPICTDSSCIDGTVCDHSSGRCRAASAPASMGRAVGQSCVPTGQPGATDQNRCMSGLCAPEVTYDSRMNPVYTGTVGGFCYSRCILPSGYNSSTFWPDPDLPQANCASGAVCIPNSSLAEGDIGLCFQGCQSDSDCRESEGYVCHLRVRLGTRTIRLHTGWCEPGDCVNTAGFMCPSGTVCRQGRNSSGAATGDCVPAASVGDAGVGATDAGPDA